MEIHWNKWVIECLPFRFRKSVMIAFCTVLITPLQTLYNGFNQYRKRMKIKAGGSPQVCMLQKIVKDSLGIDMVILEGNGKPVDFIIQTAFADVDKERQLFALLDRYKLAGKSYMYENKQLLFTTAWDGFVCQRLTVDAVWNGWMCEKMIIRKILFVNLKLLPSDSLAMYEISITLLPDVVLDREMTVDCDMWNPITGEEYTVTSTPFKRSGNYSVTVKRAGDVSIGGNLSRYKDEWYDYVLKVE